MAFVITWSSLKLLVLLCEKNVHWMCDGVWPKQWSCYGPLLAYDLNDTWQILPVNEILY